VHGSCYIMNLHGIDSTICWHLSRKLNCIVIDAGYRKAPEYPWPAPVYGIMDVVAYVQANPDTYDLSRITMGGYSAGGTLALCATAALPQGTIKALVPWYPSCDFRIATGSPGIPALGEPGADVFLAQRAREEEAQRAAAGPPGPGVYLNVYMRSVFTTCFVPPGTDRSDPRLSAICADASSFPPTTIICGTRDSLYSGCVNFVKHLKDGGVEVEFYEVAEAQHAWERAVLPGTPFEEHRTKAWKLTEDRLQKAFAA